jgi:hypothetical protein
MRNAILFSLLMCLLICLMTGEVRAQTHAPSRQPAKATSKQLQKQEHQQNSAPSNGRGQVLDFEGEVIEGERKRPDLFLQISTKDLSFDSLLYLRNNFNDYLEVDKTGRNRYFRVKGK